MTAVWMYLSGRAKEFICDDCIKEMRFARNCGGAFEHKKFAFQIGQIEDKQDLEDKIIYECPRGRVGQFENLLWSAYQDSKLKKELGIDNTEVSAVKFDAFRTFEISCNDYNDYKQKQETKKVKRSNRGRR